jgi:hypothetical protein
MRKTVLSSNPKDFEVSKMQDRLLEGVNQALSSLLVDAVLLEGISLVSGVNTISHKLGRKLSGWFVVRISAAITLFDSQATNLIQDKTLILTASGPATASLVVF